MPIYLDHAATSPIRPEVLSAYTQALGLVGNPASIHSQGQNAKRMLEEAREQVAISLGAETIEVVFTSGGTESVNLGIKGLYWARKPRRRILVTRAEHHATIDSVEWLEKFEDAEIEWIPVDETGRIRLDALEAALADDVALVTILWANNEVGTIQPIDEVVALAARHGVPVHVDAVAAYGYLPIAFSGSGIAALSVSAHKIGGPVGTGALLVARSAKVEALLHGGNQQRARSGTQDAAGAVAFGVAAATLPDPAPLRVLRDRLIDGVHQAVPSAILRGDPVNRLPGNAHFTFPGCEGDSLLFLLDMAGFSVSTGSACTAGVPEASHVLMAMGLSEADARGALRMTLGPETTAEEIDAFLAALPAAVEQAGRAGLAERTPVLGH
ncbi:MULTISPECIES: cysteine desulfurase family protein [unclassified Diaminobutyricimonas]|uniref:cysteine desulfurase family protein n=1 Tax=unclassified Diaminobutyricimonas TaxID=2643261 RepID=UPI0012F51000|nr:MULTISPECIES: cysteine desulfurase family protein [unclassified Diaminobutyricimonas]